MHQTMSQVMAAQLADRVIDALTVQQFIRPHQSVAQALAELPQRIGVGVEACEQAMGALGLVPSRVIGRLCRTELIQLGRAITRIDRHNVAVEPCPS